jgi:HAD superfamily hydrolase (TIGR01549 family)
VDIRLLSPDGLKVVLFDVDGTLYRQGPLRRAMLVRLVRRHLFRPREGWRTLRALSAYRHAQEALRDEGACDVAAAQIARACERTDIEPAALVACVERWMEQEPLPILQRFRHAGLVDFLQACRDRGLRLAAVSDYPADAKLRALGIADFFQLVLSAQSPEIGVFKPNPRGLLVALQHLGATREQCLYVGDRAEVDAAAATAAGIASVIVTSRPPVASDTHTTVTGYPQLQALLFGSGEARRLAAA